MTTKELLKPSSAKGKSVSSTNLSPVEVPERTLDWLLQGDVAIQYQTWRDLLDQEKPSLQKRIPKTGFGLAYLQKCKPNGHWGDGFYQPKWISSHYTLLDLKQFSFPNNNRQVQKSVNQLVLHQADKDGLIKPLQRDAESDVCVNGMFINYASYFQCTSEQLHFAMDYLLTLTMEDGGFNCRINRSGAHHSSLHSTLSVLEGFHEYLAQGNDYRQKEIERSMAFATEFVLQHRLYKSDRTGEIIHPDFLKPIFPARWKYNIFRCLDYFQAANLKFDARMTDALEVLIKKLNPDGQLPALAGHPGQVHLRLEPLRQPGRWATLLALRVLKHFDLLRIR